MAEIIILRGLPCSGKTSWVRKQYEDRKKITDVSADKFFYRSPDGTYQFDPTKLSQAHAMCLSDYIDRLNRGLGEDDIVVVDNTNLSAYEIAPYYQLVGALCKPSTKVKILEFRTSLEICMSRNRKRQELEPGKAIPGHLFFDMERRLLTEQLPPFWTRELAFG